MQCLLATTYQQIMVHIQRAPRPTRGSRKGPGSVPTIKSQITNQKHPKEGGGNPTVNCIHNCFSRHQITKSTPIRERGTLTVDAFAPTRDASGDLAVFTAHSHDSKLTTRPTGQPAPDDSHPHGAKSPKRITSAMRL